MRTAVSPALQAMPKLELHIHLEGTFDLDMICALAEKAGEPLPRPREELLRFEGLTEFLEMLDWICSLVHHREDARALAYRYAQYARTRRQSRCGGRGSCPSPSGASSPCPAPAPGSSAGSRGGRPC